MAAEAALVAEELGKIVSAQQIFVLRKAIYRLTAHSTNPHAVLCAHLPLRSARGALRQSVTPRHVADWVSVAIRTRCAETKTVPFVITSISLVAIRTNCAERRSKPLKYISIEVLISDAREAYYEAQNSTIFPPSRKDPDDHDRIHLHSHESLLPAIWEARLCHGCKAAARRAEPQHGGPLCVPGVRHLRGGFRPLG